jgi:hypothetical protein
MHNFIRSTSADGRPRFATDLVLSRPEKALKGVVYFGKHTRTLGRGGGCGRGSGGD